MYPIRPQPTGLPRRERMRHKLKDGSELVMIPMSEIPVAWEAKRVDGTASSGGLMKRCFVRAATEEEALKLAESLLGYDDWSRVSVKQITIFDKRSARGVKL